MYSHWAKLILIVGLIALNSCGFADAGTIHSENAAPGISPQEAITQADRLYTLRENLEKAKDAVATLKRARNPENRNFEVEWKFAQYSYYVGSRRNLSDDESAKFLKYGLNAARIARRLKPDRPEGHFWFGAILGEQSKRSPVTVGIVSIGKIRSAMMRVIEIDPKYAGASAYDALGQVELSSRGLAGGDPKKALENFQKAYELSKDNSYIPLHLAEALLILDRDGEAKKYLQSLIESKAHPDFVPEHAEAVKDAKKLLKEKF